MKLRAHVRLARTAFEREAKFEQGIKELMIPFKLMLQAAFGASSANLRDSASSHLQAQALLGR